MGRALETLLHQWAHRLLSRYVRDDVANLLCAAACLYFAGRWVAVRVSRITSPDWDAEPEPEPEKEGSFLKPSRKLSDRW